MRLKKNIGDMSLLILISIILVSRKQTSVASSLWYRSRLVYSNPVMLLLIEMCQLLFFITDKINKNYCVADRHGKSRFYESLVYAFS